MGIHEMQAPTESSMISSRETISYNRLNRSIRRHTLTRSEHRRITERVYRPTVDSYTFLLEREAPRVTPEVM